MPSIVLKIETLIFIKSFQFTPLFFYSYAETVGLEGPFRSESISRGGTKFQHQIKLKGNLYKEVDNVEVTLTTDAEDKPSDFEFKVFL